jgi:hypothetical protein
MTYGRAWRYTIDIEEIDRVVSAFFARQPGEAHLRLTVEQPSHLLTQGDFYDTRRASVHDANPKNTTVKTVNTARSNSASDSSPPAIATCSISTA